MRGQRIILLFALIILFRVNLAYAQESEPPLYFIMSFGANCHSAEYNWEQIDGIIKDGHMKILDIIEKHPTSKIHMSLTGFTADMYSVFFPVAKYRWQKALERGQVSFSAWSYSYPLYTMNQKEDIVRNVIKGIACLKTAWSPINEKIGGLPENRFDLTIHRKLNDSGIIYSFVPRVQIPTPEWDYSEDWQKPWFHKGVITLDGADGGQLICLLSGGTENLANIIKGNQQKAIDTIYKIQEINKKMGGGMLIMFGADAEFLYTPQGLQAGAVEGLDKFLTELEKIPFLKFITPEEYLNIQKPEARYTIDYGQDYSYWTKEESDYYIIENVTKNRKNLLDLKEKLKIAEFRRRDISEAKMLYEEAWIHAMLSQNSDALGLHPSSDKIEYGKIQTQITEKIIDDCLSLLNKTKKLEKTETKRDWRFAVGETPGKANPVWPAVNVDMWEKVVFPNATKRKEIRTRDWVKSKNIENFPGFFPDNQIIDWTWYRTDNLIVPEDYYDKSIYLIFDGIAGNALVCVNGLFQYTASHQESDEPLENNPDEYGKFIVYANNLINPPGKENTVAVKIKNVSGLAGIYGKIYVACVK